MIFSCILFIVEFIYNVPNSEVHPVYDCVIACKLHRHSHISVHQMLWGMPKIQKGKNMKTRIVTTAVKTADIFPFYRWFHNLWYLTGRNWTPTCLAQTSQNFHRIYISFCIEKTWPYKIFYNNWYMHFKLVYKHILLITLQ